MSQPKPPTRAAAVYEQVKRDIFAGDLQPGQRLRLIELADRFSVSQSVVREALTRLTEQGLAASSPQQGFRVVSLSLTDLDELTEARCDIEALAFRYAVQRGTMQWESNLVAAHHMLATTPICLEGAANPAWSHTHEQFHRALLAGCGNSRLLDVALSLRDSAAIYRHWSRPIGQAGERDVAAEHKALLDVALARDSDSAAALLAEHIERTSAALRPIATEP